MKKTKEIIDENVQLAFYPIKEDTKDVVWVSREEIEEKINKFKISFQDLFFNLFKFYLMLKIIILILLICLMNLRG